jgi:hypothetical protein
MVTCDGAGAGHGLIERLDTLAARPGHQLVYSVGWELGERERTAPRQVPGEVWQIAIGPGGEIRERRTEGACGDRRCVHGRCWIEEAHVTELTGCCAKARPGTSSMAGRPPCASSPAGKTLRRGRV